MNKPELDQLIHNHTGFRTLEDYRRYLTQLADDNLSSGREATADDYRVMGALLDDIYAY